MQHKNKELVGAEGLEPSSPKAADFKSAAYANSATPPRIVCRLMTANVRMIPRHESASRDVRAPRP